MADIPVTTITDEGATISYTAADVGGDQVPNDGRSWFVVKNGGGAPITVTVTPQNTTKDNVPGFGKMTKATTNEVIAAGDDGIFGPFPQQAWDDTAAKVSITYSDVTSVTIAAFKLSS